MLLFYSLTGLSQKTVPSPSLTQQLDSCELWANSAPQKGLEESLLLFQKALQMEDTVFANASLIWAAKSLVNLAEFDSAISVLSSPLLFFRSHKSKYSIHTLFQLARAHYYLGEYEPAQLFLLEAETQSFLTDHPFLRTRNLHLLGEVNRAAGIYSIAKTYFHQALYMAVKDGNKERQAAALNRLGYTSYQLSQHDSAVLYLNQSLSLSKKIENQNWLATNYNDLGEVYNNQKQYSKAKDLYQEALDIVKDPDQLINAHNNLAASYWEERDYPQAIFHVNEALELAKRTNILSHQLRALEILANIHKDKGELQKSAEYYKLYIETYRDFQGRNRVGKMNQLEISFRNRQKQLEVENLKIEAEKQALQNKLYASVVILLLIIVGVVTYTYSALQKTKTQRALAAKLSAEALAKAEAAQRKLTEQELEYQKRELMAQSVQLMRQSDKMDQIKEHVHELKEPNLANLRKALKSHELQEKDWSHFDISFTKLHPKFIEGLTNVNANLTQKEKRLATLVKTGMSNHELSAILSISTTSVNQSKYRLKKKLNLEPDQSLEGFFENLTLT